MPSTFTENTGIELIADGEQSGAWGQTTNDNFDIVDRALNGSVSIALSGTTHTLTTSSGVLSDGQAAAVVFTGSIGGPTTITVSPNTAQKTYLVRNDSNQPLTITQGSGGDVTVLVGKATTIACTGEGATSRVFEVGIADINFATGVLGTLPIANGGTGTTSAQFASLTTNVTDTLPVANGGTGRSTITSGAIVLGNGTGQVGQLTGTGIGQIPQWNGSTWTADELPSSGVLGVTASAPLASSGGATPDLSLTGIIPIANGGTGTDSTQFANLTTNVTDTLPVANGGTGRSTITAGAIVLGNGTGIVNQLTGTAVGQVATWTGSAWSVGSNDVTGNVTGDLTGDVTGNVTGDLTGDVTGNVTGNVTGDLAGNVDINGGTIDGTVIGSTTPAAVSGTTGSFSATVSGTTGSFSADATIHGATVGRGAGGISSNTAVGSGALSSNTAGVANTANGRSALLNNTTGFNNTANGNSALKSNTTGINNTANGNSALVSNTTGINNTANGYLALQLNTTGIRNTANGTNALRVNTTGSFDTANGSQALANNTTGDRNTAIGFQALFSNTTGGNNIGIGVSAGRSTSPRKITTASNEICIGNNDHTGAFIKIGLTITSDARDKTKFSPIPHGLDFVNALQPTEYQFKAGGRDGAADGIRRYGFLAQDVLASEGDNPVIVNNDDPDSLKMTHDYLIPVLVNAVKELMAEVAALKGQ